MGEDHFSLYFRAVKRQRLTRRQAIVKARSEGLGEEDVLHTAVEACVRYGREGGAIGDVLACETLYEHLS
jgi:hypothetical protein